ncbi:MAG: hypothetical protein M3437_08125 [Chloroflexota bacterium]|nr:hypothetical protein [Chloroflexota bacterium]MDQ5867474.1 hypothetical protein [Chloroflexota bacterium]
MQAAHNNAVWCDTVCRAHGKPGEFRQGMWLNRQTTPPFYPNAVTLGGPGESATQLEHVRELLQAQIPGAWAVKDSFCALDLAALGFELLFEAAWLYREASPPDPGPVSAGQRSARISTATDLILWERAWSGESDESEGEQGRIFPPVLLADENVVFIAIYEDQSIVAGAIGNRTGEVVGISNIFLPAHDIEQFRAWCVAGVMATFPGLPLVGYEAGQDLVAMQALGFEEVGPLRVWETKQAS